MRMSSTSKGYISLGLKDVFCLDDQDKNYSELALGLKIDKGLKINLFRLDFLPFSVFSFIT